MTPISTAQDRGNVTKLMSKDDIFPFLRHRASFGERCFLN